MNPTSQPIETSDLVINRVFEAPLERVYRAWTEAEHLKHWWGPKGFTMGVMKLNVHPGGVFHYCMTSPDGQEMWGKFAYREVVPLERLVFTSSFSDAEGNTTPNPFAPVWPLEILNTLIFAEHEGKTNVTMRGRPFEATDEERAAFEQFHANVQQGFKGTFDQLDAFLLSLQG